MLFSFKHGMLFCCSQCQSKTEVNQSFLDFMGIFLMTILNYLIPKIAFDFTAGRLSENVKIRPQLIHDFFCNKGAIGTPLQQILDHAILNWYLNNVLSFDQ